MRFSVANSERPLNIVALKDSPPPPNMRMTVYQKQRPLMLDAGYSKSNSHVTSSDRSSATKLKVEAKISNWFLSSAGNFYEYEITLMCPEVNHEPWTVRRPYSALRQVVLRLQKDSPSASLLIPAMAASPPIT